jgi:ATP-dependent helicase IRC3
MMFVFYTHGGILVKLKEYQTECIEKIIETFKNSNKQFVEMPTGSGKTITFLSYCSRFSKKTLIILPSRQLLKQVYESCLLFYHKSQISRKGDGHDEKIADIHLCIVNSMRNEYLENLCKNDFDLVIIDEAHHSFAQSYLKVIRKFNYMIPNIKFLGFTATPDRRDGQFIIDLFSKKSFCLEIKDLIQKKHLSEVEGYVVRTHIDLTDIDSHNDDFSLVHLYKKLCIESRNKLILDIAKNGMKDRKTLIFCINIDHSKKINELLNKEGLSSAHIDGTFSCEEREAVLSAFRRGEYQYICNCQLLTEGFDEPSIDGIILARPTTSKSLYLQMVGRGLRLSPSKKNCKIIDIVDGHSKLRGFNDFVIDQPNLPKCEKFTKLKDIEDHVESENIKIKNYNLQRINFFNTKGIYQEYAVFSQVNYLKENNIFYHSPLSFDDASFLIWYNELKKEYYGIHKNKKKI